MTMAGASAALFFDVGHFAAGRHLAILADNAAAIESGEAKQPNETHSDLRAMTFTMSPSKLCAWSHYQWSIRAMQVTLLKNLRGGDAIQRIGCRRRIIAA
jgi:hypothetical protein